MICGEESLRDFESATRIPDGGLYPTFEDPEQARLSFVV